MYKVRCKYTEREERKPKRSIIFSCCQGNSHPELQQSTNSTFLLFIKCVCVFECIGRGWGVQICRLKFIDYVMVFYFTLNSSLLYVFAGSSSSLRKVSFQKHFQLPRNYYGLWEKAFLHWLLFVKLWEETARSFSQGLDSGKAVIFLIQLCTDYCKTYL